jgi:hypothetical protein
MRLIRVAAFLRARGPVCSICVGPRPNREDGMLGLIRPAMGRSEIDAAGKKGRSSSDQEKAERLREPASQRRLGRDGLGELAPSSLLASLGRWRRSRLARHLDGFLRGLRFR